MFLVARQTVCANSGPNNLPHDFACLRPTAGRPDRWGLQALAADWRRRALQGDKFARGRVHEFEVASRRRRQLEGQTLAVVEPPRPVATLAEVPDRWRRWRAVASWGLRSETV